VFHPLSRGIHHSDRKVAQNFTSAVLTLFAVLGTLRHRHLMQAVFPHSRFRLDSVDEISEDQLLNFSDELFAPVLVRHSLSRSGFFKGEIPGFASLVSRVLHLLVIRLRAVVQAVRVRFSPGIRELAGALLSLDYYPTYFLDLCSSLWPSAHPPPRKTYKIRGVSS